ncbi:MAG: hypothetical protein LH616_04710, partial [Ilumatobacteraceae bacterium]|nr:hypothetical protein [Ilumatobacteraceae bacterium]
MYANSTMVHRRRASSRYLRSVLISGSGFVALSMLGACVADDDDLSVATQSTVSTPTTVSR